MCVGVCVCTCVYLCTYTHVDAHAHTHMHVNTKKIFVHACTYNSVHACRCAHAYRHTRKYRNTETNACARTRAEKLCMHVLMYVCICTTVMRAYAKIRAYIRTDTCVRTYMHKHVCE